MGADGYGRVNKHVVVERKKRTRTITPKPRIQSPAKTQKQPTTQSILMENTKIRKVETRIQGQGETHTLEIVYKPNDHGESKKKPHAQPPHHTFNHRQNTKTNNNQNLIH